MDQLKNNTSPIVNICMITYNHEKYITEAIEGVLMQKTTFPIQLIIGEDCSTDKTRKICEEYKKKYPNIIKLLPKLEHNIGMMANFINTLRACKGKYIAICEGDDFWIDENKLQMQFDILEKNSQYSLVYSFQYILKNDILNKNQNTKPGIKKNIDVLLGFIPPTRTVFFRNIDKLDLFLEKLGNQPSGDKFLAYYLSQFGDFICLEKHTAVYRMTGEGVWTSLKSNEQLILSLIHYFLFLKLVNTYSFKLYIRKHLIFIHNLTDWQTPRNAQKTYFKSIRSLYLNKLTTQCILLITLIFYFNVILVLKVAKNKFRFK